MGSSRNKNFFESLKLMTDGIQKELSTLVYKKKSRRALEYISALALANDKNKNELIIYTFKLINEEQGEGALAWRHVLQNNWRLTKRWLSYLSELLLKTQSEPEKLIINTAVQKIADHIAENPEAFIQRKFKRLEKLKTLFHSYPDVLSNLHLRLAPYLLQHPNQLTYVSRAERRKAPLTKFVRAKKMIQISLEGLWEDNPNDPPRKLFNVYTNYIAAKPKEMSRKVFIGVQSILYFYKDLYQKHKDKNDRIKETISTAQQVIFETYASYVANNPKDMSGKTWAGVKKILDYYKNGKDKGAPNRKKTIFSKYALYVAKNPNDMMRQDPQVIAEILKYFDVNEHPEVYQAYRSFIKKHLRTLLKHDITHVIAMLEGLSKEVKFCPHQIPLKPSQEPSVQRGIAQWKKENDVWASENILLWTTLLYRCNQSFSADTRKMDIANVVSLLQILTTMMKNLPYKIPEVEGASSSDRRKIAQWKKENDTLAREYVALSTTLLNHCHKLIDEDLQNKIPIADMVSFLHILDNVMKPIPHTMPEKKDLSYDDEPPTSQVSEENTRLLESSCSKLFNCIQANLNRRGDDVLHLLYARKAGENFCLRDKTYSKNAYISEVIYFVVAFERVEAKEQFPMFGVSNRILLILFTNLPEGLNLHNFIDFFGNFDYRRSDIVHSFQRYLLIEGQFATLVKAGTPGDLDRLNTYCAIFKESGPWAEEIRHCLNDFFNIENILEVLIANDPKKMLELLLIISTHLTSLQGGSTRKSTRSVSTTPFKNKVSTFFYNKKKNPEFSTQVGALIQEDRTRYRSLMGPHGVLSSLIVEPETVNLESAAAVGRTQKPALSPRRNHPREDVFSPAKRSQDDSDLSPSPWRPATLLSAFHAAGSGAAVSGRRSPLPSAPTSQQSTPYGGPLLLRRASYDGLSSLSQSATASAQPSPEVHQQSDEVPESPQGGHPSADPSPSTPPRPRRARLALDSPTQPSPRVPSFAAAGPSAGEATDADPPPTLEVVEVASVAPSHGPKV